MPKISYVVPVYNAEKTLLRCVESLVYGDEADCEVLLSEDCSKDDSWKLCLELAQRFPQVRCIRNEKNSGVSRTRNHALEEATGEYILFVDSDDWVCHRYADRLIKTAQEYPNSLVVCGFRFLDQTENSRRDYCWPDSDEERVFVDKTALFSVMDHVLLQFLWNKAFRRDVIEKAHIRFDVTQSMGEDFEFVLDYMKALSCEQAVVINEPLYTYIRANNTSLMSKFGLIENDAEFARLKKLMTVAGEDNEYVQQQYERAVTVLRNNYVYHIARSPRLKKREKLPYIARLVGDAEAKKRYSQQKVLMTKESLAQLPAKLNGLKGRLTGRLQRERNQRTIKKQQQQFAAKPFTIVSQNCIGGVFYHDMGMAFQSPTINLYFESPDFIRFVKDLPKYMNTELRMRWGLDYPIGTLEDVEIHFMHYHTCQEAKESWERRKERVDLTRVVVLCTDMEAFDDAAFEEWKTIPYPKVLFTANERYAGDAGSVYYAEYQSLGKVPDLIPSRRFYDQGILMRVVNGIDDAR